MMGKRGIFSGIKGQISGFLIVVIIIVIMVVLFFFIKRIVVYDVNPYPVISPSFQPVTELVDVCFKNSIDSAIKISAMQGGYIKLPKRILYNKDANIELVPGGLIKVPLWFYKGFNYAPSIETIQEQMSDYIEEKVVECTDKFSSLSNQYKIEEKFPNVKTEIMDNSISFSMTYPLHIEKLDTNEVLDIRDFKKDVKSSYKKLYSLAKAMHYSEDKGTFLENTTINLMALDENVPFTGMEFTCKRKKWLIKDVISSIKSMLWANLPKVRIDGTDYSEPESPYVKNQMIWKLNDDSSGDYGSIKASIYYNKDWPFGFRVRPKEGNAMYARQSKAFVDYLSSFCIALYHFTYDISYPVMIILEDRDGLTFRYGEPVVINHNKAERSQYAISDFVVPIYQEDFCSDKTDKKYTIVATDVRTGMDIENANVTITCVTRLCPLGTTSFDGSGYSLETSLPASCSSGKIEVTHDDYMPEKKYIDFKKDYIVVDMTPKFKVDYKVYRHTVDNPVLKKGLEEGEEALIMIKHDDENNILKYPDDNKVKLDLIGDDASYNVTIFLVKGDKIMGGYNGTFSYTYDDIADARLIEFNVVDYGQEMDNFTQYNYSMYYPKIIKVTE